MGRPPKARGAGQPTSQPAEQLPPKPATETPPAGEQKVGGDEGASTITLRLDERGRILPLRDETRERLKRALEASDLGEEYRRSAGAQFVDEALAGRMLDAFGAVQGFVFSKTAKLPYADAAKVMRFDEEERKTLAPPTCALLNQYVGPRLARHGVLVEFSLMFAAVEASKIDKAVALVREHQKMRDGNSG
jgi:hypothetical protein